MAVGSPRGPSEAAAGSSRGNAGAVIASARKERLSDIVML